MGRNAAIKRYNATPDGQSMELFDEPTSKLPVVIELLRSPWVTRASELLVRDGAGAPKRREETVDVTWVWASERAWWDPREHVSRRYWRVLARGGVYDLAYDRIAGEWRLVGIQD